MRQAVDQGAHVHGSAPFLIDPESGREVSFDRFRLEVRHVAAWLCRLGLARGDKVAFLLDNGVFTFELMIGAMYGGFVPVPLSPVAGPNQLRHTLDHCDASVVCCAARYRALLDGCVPQIQRPIQILPIEHNQVIEPDEQAWAAAHLPAPLPGNDALIIYTSGTTGEARGVVFSHRNLMSGIADTIRVYGFNVQDRALSLLPLYHLNALVTTFLPMFLSGGSVVVPERFNAVRMWSWVTHYHCTWFAAVPAIVAQLVSREATITTIEANGLAGLRFVRCSSAPLPPSLHQQFEDRFGVLLVEGMGMTEAGEILQTSPLREARRMGSPGRPQHELRVVDEAGRDVPVGQTGEMQIRGPGLMQGYHKAPEASRQVLGSDGWLRTGDLVRQDDDGYVFIAGRLKDVIIKSGVNISPREIDEALVRHPDVLEAAVIGIPDPQFGEDLVAHVVLKPGVDRLRSAVEQDLLTHCLRLLGAFKTPSKIWLDDNLPRGPSGKIQRRRLVERHVVHAASIPDSLPVVMSVAGDFGAASESSRERIEEALATIWKNVLDLDDVGRMQNFFDLGGDSLSAQRVLARVLDHFRISLPLRTLFDRPTIATLAAQIDAIDLVAEPKTRLAAVHRFDDKSLPLSFAQQGLWLQQQLEPSSTAWNITRAWRLSGPLDVDALEAGLNRVVQRHAILRTTFVSVEGGPVQRISPHGTLTVSRTDFSSHSLHQQISFVQRYVEDETRRPFDLESGPLLRVSTLRLRETEHTLVLGVHHIVFDRWSVELFLRELGSSYCENSAQQMPQPTGLPVQYVDYAVWQRALHQEATRQTALAYWRRQLAGAPEQLTLPADRPRPPARSLRGARVHASFPPALTDGLRATGHEHGATLFMTLLAAFNVLLHRYTGQDDLVLGSPGANRERVELEHLIGCFVNMLVLRTDLSGDPTFRQLLQQVKDVVLSATTHQALPFEKLVEALQPQRTTSASPLFQVVFHHRNVPPGDAHFPDLQMESIRIESGTAQYDLTLSVCESATGLDVEVEYAIDLFETDTIHRMISHYQQLLAGIVADPDSRLSGFLLTTSLERQQMLRMACGEAIDLPRDLGLHQMFERQAERTPDAVAVVDASGPLTYAMLNDQADHLADALTALGVHRSVMVGVCLQRSRQMVVSLLAILKCGGAWVPLDPRLPADRMAFMLEDSAATLVLTEEVLRSRLSACTCRVISLDETGATHLPRPRRQRTEMDSGVPAYMLYTSGTTGRPKGVVIQHKNVVSLMHAVHQVFSPEDLAGVIAAASLGFDLSIFEIFAPLTCGGACLIVEDALAIETLPAGILPTLFSAVPSTFEELLHLRAVPDSVRVLVSGGEFLSRERVRRMYASTSVERVYDLYGPTECTICSTASLRTAVGPETIGRPLANARVYVLDSQRNLQPVGIPGEIWIGGTGVAQGYHQRAELDAEKFVPDPFAQASGARMYRTGDRARYLADGTLQYLGRLDDQVKLRGFRIEPGEIESVLLDYPGVQAASVVLRDDLPGGPGLIGYVAGIAGPTALNDIHDLMAAKLPEYMVPRGIVLLDAIPRLPSGKVDRDALPLPDLLDGRLQRRFVAPRSTMERVLAEIWSEVLGVDSQGVTENFFELGGHSLMAAQVVGRIRARCGVALSLRAFFESPTIAGNAVLVERLQQPADPPGES